MALIPAISGTGGGYEVTTGSFDNTASASFDCGLVDPDAVIVFQNRAANDWTWVYFKAGAFDDIFTYMSNPLVQNGSVGQTYNDRLTVNGSIVSTTSARWGTLYWAAIKKK